MTSTAAIDFAPIPRPAAGQGKAASSAASGESFATILGAELGDDTSATAAMPQVELAAPVSLSATPQPAAGEAIDLAAALVASDGAEAASAATAFQSALASVDSPALAATAGQNTKAATPAVATGQPIATPAPAPVASAAQAATPAVTALAATLFTASGFAASGFAASGKPGAPATAMQSSTRDASSEPDTLASDANDGSDATPTAIVTGLAPPQAAPAPAVANIQTQASSGAFAPTGEATARPTAPAAPSAAPGEARAEAAGLTQSDNAHTGTAKPAQAVTNAGAQHAANPSAQANGQSPSAASVPVDAAAQGGNAAAAANAAQSQSTTPAQATADAARSPATPAALQSAPAATVQVYSRIIERNDGRAQRFDLRLDPAELGRVDVRIEIGADKKVHAVLAAHDSAALADLMRGQRALERALTDAGLDLADKGVRFELSSDTGRGASQQREGDADGRSSSPNVWRGFDTAAVPVSAEAAAIAAPSWHPQRYDLVA